MNEKDKAGTVLTGEFFLQEPFVKLKVRYWSELPAALRALHLLIGLAKNRSVRDEQIAVIFFFGFADISRRRLLEQNKAHGLRVVF